MIGTVSFAVVGKKEVGTGSKNAVWIGESCDYKELEGNSERGRGWE